MSNLQAVHLLVPGDLDTLTGGYVYDRRMVEELRAHGVRVTVQQLHDSFPAPSDAALSDANAALASIRDGALTVIDGLALGAMPQLVKRHAERLRIVALVHHPLALESGLDAACSRALRDSERASLAHVRAAIVTSQSTAQELVTRYAMPRERVWVVEPGTDLGPISPRSAAGPGDTLDASLLCVATLTPRKGHDILVRSLARLADRAWTLRCVGSLQRDPETVSAVRARIDDCGLRDRVQLLGEVERSQLSQHYASADVLVLASRHEGYGMVLSEAFAHGLPVIATRAGAVVDTVPEGAGLLVPVDDVSALSEALARFMSDPALRNELRRGARRARSATRSWSCAGREFSSALSGVGPP